MKAWVLFSSPAPDQAWWCLMVIPWEGRGRRIRLGYTASLKLNNRKLYLQTGGRRVLERRLCNEESLLLSQWTQGQFLSPTPGATTASNTSSSQSDALFQPLQAHTLTHVHIHTYNKSWAKPWKLINLSGQCQQGLWCLLTTCLVPSGSMRNSISRKYQIAIVLTSIHAHISHIHIKSNCITQKTQWILVHGKVSLSLSSGVCLARDGAEKSKQWPTMRYLLSILFDRLWIPWK